MEKFIITKSKDETVALGEALASTLACGDVILLKGDLGAGKTTFVSGVGKALGAESNVISPTFNIMKCYFKGRIPLYHIDAYRLENQNIELGLDEFIEGDGACFIEWPDFIAPLLPAERLTLSIHNLGGDNRQLSFSAEGEHYEKEIMKMEEIYGTRK